jgi:hypothetical protein
MSQLLLGYAGDGSVPTQRSAETLSRSHVIAHASPRATTEISLIRRILTQNGSARPREFPPLTLRYLVQVIGAEEGSPAVMHNDEPPLEGYVEAFGSIQNDDCRRVCPAPRQPNDSYYFLLRL